MIDFREFEFGHTAFMYFPLLHRVFSSKKRMKKQGRRRVHTCKSEDFKYAYRTVQKITSKTDLGYSQVSSALPAVKRTKLEKHF